MNKAKVTILNQYFYPENITAASLPYELASGLVRAGYTVRALVGTPHEYFSGTVSKKEVVSGITVERMDYTFRNRSTVLGRLINYLSFFFAILKNHKKLKDTDILITYSSPPINPIIPAYFAKRYNFKMIYVVYDLYPDMACKFNYLKQGGLAARAFTAANTYVFERCEKIVVLSHEMKDYFVANKGFEEKVAIIPNWYAEQPTKKPVKKSEKLKILYGGNVGIVQDIATLANSIVAVKNNKNVEFVFAAHGSRLGNLMDTLKKNGVTNAHELGFMPKEQYDSFLDEIDLAVISLDERMCGLASPSKFYSYIAKGLPVLFIGPGNMDVAKEIVKYKIGFVIPNGDAKKVQKIITDLAHDKTKLADMGKRARQLFTDTYTAEHCVKKYEDLLQDISKEA